MEQTEKIFNRVQEIYTAKGQVCETKGLFGRKFTQQIQNLEEIGRDELFQSQSVALDHHGILTRPSKNLTVLIIGNHSAGKSSFINWYINQKIQSTGIAIETSHFTMIKYGEKEAELKTEGTMSIYPFLREIMNRSPKSTYGKFFSNLTTRICSKRSRKFENIDFIDTPGLTDAGISYNCDILEMMKWVCNFVDVVLVFLDPVGQALCSKTLDMIQYLQVKHSHKLRVCLTKIDQVDPEDFSKLNMQVYSAICAKTQEMHFEIIPISINKDYSGEFNKIDELLEGLEFGFKGKAMRNVEIMTNDCRYVVEYCEIVLAMDRSNSKVGGVFRWIRRVLVVLGVVAFMLVAFQFVENDLDFAKLDKEYKYLSAAGFGCLLISLLLGNCSKKTLNITQLNKLTQWINYCNSAIEEGERMTQAYFNS